jgi:hypothetical protein
MPNLKVKSRTHYWADIENYIIKKCSQYLPLELQQCFQRYNCLSMRDSTVLQEAKLGVSVVTRQICQPTTMIMFHF